MKYYDHIIVWEAHVSIFKIFFENHGFKGAYGPFYYAILIKKDMKVTIDLLSSVYTT